MNDNDVEGRLAAALELVEALTRLGWTPPAPIGGPGSADGRIVEQVLADPAVASLAEELAVTRTRGVYARERVLAATSRARQLGEQARHARESSVQRRTASAQERAERRAAALGDAPPRSLRRVVALIEADPAQSLSLPTLAGAAGVQPRSLQAAFAKHLGTTPTRFVRQVRLEHAHDELVHGDPGELKIEDVARRWGFSNAGRFAGQYRQAFGCTPRETLQT